MIIFRARKSAVRWCPIEQKYDGEVACGGRSGYRSAGDSAAAVCMYALCKEEKKTLLLVFGWLENLVCGDVVSGLDTRAYVTTS